MSALGLYLGVLVVCLSAPDNNPPPPTYAQLQDANRQGSDYEQIHLGLPTTTTTTRPTTTTRTPAAEREHDYYSVSSSLSPAVV